MLMSHREPSSSPAQVGGDAALTDKTSPEPQGSFKRHFILFHWVVLRTLYLHSVMDL